MSKENIEWVGVVTFAWGFIPGMVYLGEVLPADPWLWLYAPAWLIIPEFVWFPMWDWLLRSRA